MKNDGLTPMMRQYFSFKAKYPDKILFFRMGDFYEMFGDDAVEAAPILGIALTSRSVDKTKAVPLCGIPYHALNKYLPRLIEAGKKVVICEQVEDPKKAKGIVKRDVVEIVTPGTSTADNVLDPTRNSYLAALCGKGKNLALARLELSTGHFSVTENDAEIILDQLQSSPPKELLLPAEDKDDLLPKSLIENGLAGIVTPLEDIYFDFRLARDRLCRFFAVSTLDGFGLNRMNAAVSAAGAVFSYLEDNKQDRLTHITEIKVGRHDHRMMLDAATVRNLELFTNLAGGTDTHSFFWAINRTGSAAGARRLRRAVAAPFIAKAKIDARLEAVANLFDRDDLSESMAEVFTTIPDLERLAGRLGLGKANPR
ncbi:MAG: DNA mismatch repair protein MutS, partial [FCB group bacterium]|nr:DNA mismatch repair protein MutS [FCB group bacterium]